MPWELEIDYVEVSTYNEGTGVFDLQWRDDFDTFDATRWIADDDEAGDWGSSNFYPENVSVKDGSLVLKLEVNAEYDSAYRYSVQATALTCISVLLMM